jgi:hypothetical protein
MQYLAKVSDPKLGLNCLERGEFEDPVLNGIPRVISGDNHDVRASLAYPWHDRARLIEKLAEDWRDHPRCSLLRVRPPEPVYPAAVDRVNPFQGPSR